MTSGLKGEVEPQRKDTNEWAVTTRLPETSTSSRMTQHWEDECGPSNCPGESHLGQGQRERGLSS